MLGHTSDDMESLLSIDDLKEDLEKILQWAIVMKSDNEVALDFQILGPFLTLGWPKI